MIRARYALVRARTALVCAARGLTKAFGERIRGRNPKGFGSATAETLSPQLQVALAPMLRALEAITTRIRELTHSSRSSPKRATRKWHCSSKSKGLAP